MPGLCTRCTPTGRASKATGTRVFAALRRCHEVVHEMDAPRVSTTIKVGTRTDKTQSMADKVRSVQLRLRS